MPYKLIKAGHKLRKYLDLKYCDLKNNVLRPELPEDLDKHVETFNKQDVPDKSGIFTTFRYKPINDSRKQLNKNASNFYQPDKSGDGSKEGNNSKG